MARRRTCSVFLSLLALFLFGTVIVLSTVSFYLAIDPIAYLSQTEVENNLALRNDTGALKERIPRILHQTWISDVLPDQWKGVSQRCRELMPDYEYMLWTDASSREFIQSNYAWFLPTFDAYTYPIQRADAIRYFVLEHYGGIYLDLDVGCLKPLDPLLVYPVILPRTIPVGVSNDLMFAEKHHPFMEQTIHNLITFDHSYVLNYPTVMFSTGPMFLSAQYGLYASAHPTPGEPGDVRILPKSLYGKNAKPGEAPESFFEHHYGSSWHADDAAFITFLGRWGTILMYMGAVVVCFGFVRAVLVRRGNSSSSEGWRRRLALVPYVLMSSRSQRSGGNVHLDFSPFAISAPTSATTTRAPSPASSEPSTPIAGARIPVLPLTFEVRSPSPSSSSSSNAEPLPGVFGQSAADAMRRAGAWAWTFMGGDETPRPRSRSRGTRRSRGMFFLPAIFAPAPDTLRDDLEQPMSRVGRKQSTGDKRHLGISRSSSASRFAAPPPPPYESAQTLAPLQLPVTRHSSEWSGGWEDWSPGVPR